MMNKILAVIGFIVILAIVLVFATMFWPIVLIFLVIGTYQLTAHVFKIENTLILKLIFVGIYFVCFASISNYLHENNIKLMPEIGDDGRCINGYVCD